MPTVSKWRSSESVSVEHSTLPIRQLYLWIVTSDNHVAIVSKDNIKWQFPGGHPKEGETQLETIKRELYEETGLGLENLGSQPQHFGYYVVTTDQEEYLQLRYLLRAAKTSDSFVLSPKENPNDAGPIISAKFVKLMDLPNHISWIKEAEEYKTVLDLVG